MAKTYENNGVTLKIDSLAKKSHAILDEHGENLGKLIISRRNGVLTLKINESVKDEHYIKSIAKCYNNFIEKNPKFHKYHFDIINESGEDNLHLGTEIYTIRKDGNSPILLINKEQLEKLNEEKFHYYKYYSRILKGVDFSSGDNKKILFNGSADINVDSSDKLDGCLFTVNNNDLKPFDKNKVYFYLNFDVNKIEDCIPFKMPKIKMFAPDVWEDKELHIDLNVSPAPPIDFSDVGEHFDCIIIESKQNAYNLLETLKTIKNNPEIILDSKSIDELHLDIGEGNDWQNNRHKRSFRKIALLEALKKEIEPSDNLDNGLE